ncbi:hypothetical protein ES705_47488 [subsurface metagenome]
MSEELKAKDPLGTTIGEFTILGYKGRIVTTEDGKKHFEIDCKDKEARDDVAAVFEEEAILRINPKIVLEETPEDTQVTES